MITINPIDSEWFKCTKCDLSFIVSSQDKDFGLLKTSMLCPEHLQCKGKLRLRKKWPESGRIDGRIRQVTALTLYQACAGIGLPEERRCSPSDLKKVLIGSRIKAVQLEPAPDPRRSILMTMTLDNGRTLYFSTSTRGALIYKVTDVS